VFNNYQVGATVSFNISVQSASSGGANVALYDSLGQLIRHLWTGSISANSPITLTWDGTADDGSAVASGVYYVVFQEPSGAYLTQKVMIVR
jgi:flagellar hook assembly protein FlgD